MPVETAKSGSSFLTSVVTILGGQAGCAVLGLVMEISYARLLGPTGRGQISICLLVIGLGVLLGSLGGNAPITVWASDSEKKPSQWLAAVLLWGLFGCTLAGILWAVVYWKFPFIASQGITPHTAVLIFLNIPATVFSGYFMSVLVGAERFRVRAGVSLADQAGALVSFVAVALLFQRSANSALLGNLMGLLVGIAILVVLLRDSLRGAWRQFRADSEIVSGLRMGLRGQPGNLAGTLFYRLDVFLVSFFLGPAQLGLYALGVVISEALWQIPAAVAFALLPRTARTLNKGASEFTSLILRQVFAVASLLGVGIALVSIVAVPIVFGQRFRPSVLVIWWLLPGTIALSGAKVACSDLAARYKTGYSTVFAIIAFGVSLALDLYLIPRMGINGAALASTAAYLTDTVLVLAALKYETKTSWKSFVPSLDELVLYREASAGYWLKLRAALLPAGAAPTDGAP